MNIFKDGEILISNPNTSFGRAFGTLVPLTLLALLLSALLISFANDVYAFVKSDIPSTLYLDGSESIDGISKQLKDSGIIQNPNIFKLYVLSKGKQDTVESFRGEIKLNANLSYRQILHEFKSQNN